MNKNELRAEMVRNGDTAESLAEAIGITLGTFSKKINGVNGNDFRQHEIQIIRDRYNLSAEKVDLIFFNLQLS